MKKFITNVFGATLMIGATLFTPTGPSNAASGTANFSGTVTSPAICIITVENPDGVLAPNTAGTQLSSKLPGGSPGQATITALSGLFGSYDISVTAPAFFSSFPSGFSDPVSFAATYSGAQGPGAWGANGLTFAEQSGNITMPLNFGFSRTVVTVDLVADNPSVFKQGSYVAEATVRCE